MGQAKTSAPSCVSQPPGKHPESVRPHHSTSFRTSILQSPPSFPNMRITSLCLLTLFTCLLPAQPLDCSKASSDIEQLICKDSSLTSLDRKLASVQTEAATKMGATKPLWLDPET